MAIKAKLLVVVFIPLILLVILSSYFFVTSYLKVEKSYALEKILSNNKILSSMLLEIGKERAITALWMVDRKGFLEKKDKQIQLSDVRLKQMTSLEKEHFIFFKKVNLLDSAGYEKLHKSIEKLLFIRQEAKQSKTPFQEVFFGYQYTISTPMVENLLKLHHFTLNQEIASFILPLTQLYISKEYSDLQRGFLAYYLSKKEALSQEDLILWERLRSKANSFDMTQVTHPILQQHLTHLLNEDNVSQLITELQTNAATIHTEILTGMYEQDGVEWFDLQTKKMALLTDVEKLLSSALFNATHRYLKQQQLFLIFSAVVWVFSFFIAFIAMSTVRRIVKDIKRLEKIGALAIERKQPSDTSIKIKKVKITQTPNIEKPKIEVVKKVLILKRLTLEQRILSQYISDLGYIYDTVREEEQLLSRLETDEYGILFTDSDLVTSHIVQIPNLQIITQKISSKEQLKKYLRGMAKSL